MTSSVEWDPDFFLSPTIAFRRGERLCSKEEKTNLCYSVQPSNYDMKLGYRPWKYFGSDILMV